MPEWPAKIQRSPILDRMPIVRTFDPPLIVICSLMISVVFVVIPAQAIAQDEAAALDRRLLQIRTASSMNERSGKAKDLAEFIRELPNNNDATAFDDSRVDAIAALLQDESDSVRFWVAGALGLVGPRAARAVPALKEAFARIVAIRRSEGPVILGIDSSHAIIAALERITGRMLECPYAIEC